MSLDDYFKDELSYLKEQSKVFADTFPQAAQFLSEKSHDPDVDRTLEGFAYLTGVLHAKTEQEYPQLTYSLIDMLWPNYMQPTPSMTIIEFIAKTAEIATISRGSEIKSQPKIAQKKNNQSDKKEKKTEEKHEPIPCTFKVAREIPVLPINITAITVESLLRTSRLNIEFALLHGATLSNLHHQPMRFYLGDNPYTSSQLYLWLNHYLSSATIKTDNTSILQSELKIQPIGFEQDQAILSYPKNTYMGYRLLQEYFCFSEGYLFVDFLNLTFPEQSTATTFTLTCEFSRPLPANLKVRQNSFKLNCTPAINLFTLDSEPILLNGQKAHYPLSPNFKHAESYELFAIDSVNSWYTAPNVDNPLRTYHSFESFTHQTAHENGDIPLYYKIERRQEKTSDLIRYFISFVRGDETESHPFDEIVSMRLICTNKDEAAKLKIGDICVRTEVIPDTVTFKNISRPSITLRPNIDQSQHWTTISTLSLNYLSLLNKNALAQILRNYNFSARYSKQAESSLLKMINGIERFETEPAQQLYENLYIKGLQSTLHIDQSAFNSEGDLYLFGTVLAHFYSLFATVNSFHNLVIINSTNQEKYVWPAQIS